MKLIHQLLRLKTDFERIFFDSESQVLQGKKRSTLVALTAILFFTLVALSFAIGGIENLRKRTQNPFTNWVNLSIKSMYIADQLENIKNRYEGEEIRDKLKIKQVNGWAKFSLNMFSMSYNPLKDSPDSLLFDNIWGRNLDEEDPLINNILSEENKVWYNEEKIRDGLSSCEIVLAKSVAKQLGFDLENIIKKHIFIEIGSMPIPIEVVGIVERLPEFCNFACATSLYNFQTSCSEYLTVNNYQQKENVFKFLGHSETSVEQLNQLASNFFSQLRSVDVYLKEEKYPVGKHLWSEFSVVFPGSQIPVRDSVMQFLQHTNENKAGLFDFAKVECNNACNTLDNDNFNYLAFNFEKLKHIRDFQQDVDNEFNVEIDMTRVENGENFYRVSLLTRFMATVLLIFAVLSIVLFINSLLKSHLSKVRPNLGTLKAFGLNNRSLNKQYSKIILYFLLQAVIISFTLAVLVGLLEQYLSEESLYNLINIYIFLSILAITVVSVLLSLRTIKKILGGTPGNLIYKR